MRYRYWGWIPVLTRSLCFESGPEGRKELIDFDIANPGTVNEMLSKMGYNLSGDSYIKNEILADSLYERIRETRYQLIINAIERYDNIIKFNFSIGNPFYTRLITQLINSEIILSGTIKIRPNGLAEYVFEHNGEYASEYADQMHIAVRDIFHKHDHHSSDLPLNTVQATSDQDAIKNIASQYIQKFIEYKKISTSAPLLTAKEDLYRAKGEIEYAMAFIEANKKDLDDESFDKLRRSIRSFSNTYDILLNRILNKIEWACNHAIWTLTVFLLAFSVVLGKEIIDKWHPQPIFGWTAFSITFWIFISFALFLIINTWYCFRTSLDNS